MEVRVKRLGNVRLICRNMDVWDIHATGEAGRRRFSPTLRKCSSFWRQISLQQLKDVQRQKRAGEEMRQVC